MKKALVGLVLIALAGCATSATKLNKISLGMSKAEVIDALGDPDAVGAVGRQEDLHYVMRMGASQDTRRDFFVRIVDGRVAAYGKTGDYDSARLPSSNVNVNVHHHSSE